jgi:hypothetical protein
LQNVVQILFEGRLNVDSLAPKTVWDHLTALKTIPGSFLNALGCRVGVLTLWVVNLQLITQVTALCISMEGTSVLILTPTKTLTRKKSASTWALSWLCCSRQVVSKLTSECVCC